MPNMVVNYEYVMYDY